MSGDEKPKPKPQRKSKRQQARELERQKLATRQGVYEISARAAAQKAVFEGMLLFIQHPGLSVREIYENFRVDEKDPESPYIRDKVTWHSFREAARQSDWTDRREAHWLKIEKSILDHMHSDHVKQELAEMAQLQAAVDRLNLHIHGGVDADIPIEPVKPKSLEGVIGALVQLDKQMSAKRARVAAETAAAPEAAGSVVSGPVVEDNLTDEEVRQLAHNLISARAGLLENDDEQEADPHAGPGSGEEGEKGGGSPIAEYGSGDRGDHPERPDGEPDS